MDAAPDDRRAGTLEAGREVYTCAMLRPVTRRDRHTRAPPVVLPGATDQQVASPAESRKRPPDRGAHDLLDVEVRAGDVVAYLPALVVRVTVAEVVERLAAHVLQVADLDAQSAHRERDPRTRRLACLGALIGSEERREPHRNLVVRQVGDLLSAGWRHGHQADGEHDRESMMHRFLPCRRYCAEDRRTGSRLLRSLHETNYRRVG